MAEYGRYTQRQTHLFCVSLLLDEARGAPGVILICIAIVLADGQENSRSRSLARQSWEIQDESSRQPDGYGRSADGGSLMSFPFAKEQTMRRVREKVVIFSKHSGSLFGYASTLNTLGYYSLSLCHHFHEVIELLEKRKRFEYLIYDAFDPGLDTRALQALARYRAINSIIAVADVNSRQRQSLIFWARAHEIPLGGVLQTPLRSPELSGVMRCSF